MGTVWTSAWVKPFSVRHRGSSSANVVSRRLRVHERSEWEHALRAIRGGRAAPDSWRDRNAFDPASEHHPSRRPAADIRDRNALARTALATA